jgi:hypothetical protein
MKQDARERGLKYVQDPEWRKKVSSYGADNPMWRGGVTEETYAPGFDATLKRKIRNRDNYMCQLCGTMRTTSLPLVKDVTAELIPIEKYGTVILEF